MVQSGAEDLERITNVPVVRRRVGKGKTRVKNMALIDADNRKKYRAVNVESRNLIARFMAMRGARHHVGNGR